MISSLRSTFNFSDRRVAFLSEEKLAVYAWENGTLNCVYLFETGSEGQRIFDRYIRETPKIPFYILIDVIEEEFRVEMIPYVFGSDRAALIKRKRSRLFKETMYFYSERQGRKKEGRRDECVLFASLSNSNLVQPWTDILERYKVPLIGILSLPLLLSSFIKTLADTSNHMLVISMQSISGLRHTFFHKKRLKISRLTRLPRYGAASYVSRILDEVNKTFRYLKSMRLIPEGVPLDAYLLVNDELRTQFRSHQEHTSEIRYHFLEIDTLALERGIQVGQNNPFSDQLFVHHLLKNKPSNIYAPTKSMRYNRVRRWRYALNTISVLMLLVGVLYSSVRFIDGIRLDQDSNIMKSKIQFYTDRYNKKREHFPTTLVEPGQMKLVIDLLESLNEYKSTPVAMMKFLGLPLQNFPDIELQTIQWRSSLEPDTGDAQSGDNANNTENMHYQIAIINGYLKGVNGRYREAISRVDQFAEALRENEAAHDVMVLSLPLETSSEEDLQGNTKIISEQAEFSLRAVIGFKNNAR